MRNLCLFTLSLGLAFFLAGCGQEDKKNTPGTGGTQQSSPSKSKPSENKERSKPSEGS
jgi:hypothetical protein